MQCPRCQTETPPDAFACPGCNLTTPKGRAALRSSGRNVTEVVDRKPRKKRGSVRAIVALPAILLTIAFSGGIGYLIFYFGAQVNTDVPAQRALDKVRTMPSSKAGLSVDQSLTEQVRKSRDSGSLREAEGWGTEQMDDTHFLVVFSFEEHGDKHQRAEWLVDLKNGSVTPKSDLAAAVLGRK